MLQVSSVHGGLKVGEVLGDLLRTNARSCSFDIPGEPQTQRVTFGKVVDKAVPWHVGEQWFVPVAAVQVMFHNKFEFKRGERVSSFSASSGKSSFSSLASSPGLGVGDLFGGG